MKKNRKSAAQTSRAKPTGRSIGQSPGQVRIISGQWRGRKLVVPAVDGLRPTGDRVREMLFNWLQTHIAGSHCLDLFAGSGALGFEAGSRYAASVTLVEHQLAAFRGLEQSRDLLCGGMQGAGEKHSGSQLPHISIVHASAQQFLADNLKRFDIVFVDPPFADQLQLPMVNSLLTAHLSSEALMYVESPASQQLTELLPQNISVFREKIIGEVRAQLLRAPHA